MRYEKKVVAEMPLAYAIGTLDGSDARSFVVGVEKKGPIRRFALDGTPMETVAEGPGGVMTVTQMPGRGDQLLATSEFFSPNYGADTAGIVSYTRGADGAWETRRLCDLPYVHRFGIVQAADGRLWLLACTIKESCRQIKNDWLHAGAVFAAPLDEPVESYDVEAGTPLKLTCLASQQLQNHGFWMAPDRSYVLVATAAGVFRYTPPAAEGEPWDITCLIVQPTSDICMADFDGDGVDEILTLSPFHGDTLSVWHAAEAEDTYQLVWTDPERKPFLHAIWSGELLGEPCAIIGNRKGDRDLFRVHCVDGEYQLEVIDHDHGPANCWVTTDDDGTQRIIAANRETNEVALYTVSND